MSSRFVEAKSSIATPSKSMSDFMAIEGNDHLDATSTAAYLDNTDDIQITLQSGNHTGRQSRYTLGVLDRPQASYAIGA